MTHSMQIQDLPKQIVISVRTRSAVDGLLELMGKLYGSIAAYVEANGAHPAGPPFAAYYNMDMQDLDVEIGIPIFSPLPGTDDLKFREIPGGRFATCVHVGPYDQLAPVYQELTKWMEDNDHKPIGAAYEYYLNDPQATAPEDLQTEIRFALLD